VDPTLSFTAPLTGACFPLAIFIFSSEREDAKFFTLKVESEESLEIYL
jgi:hypothetical protein